MKIGYIKKTQNPEPGLEVWLCPLHIKYCNRSFLTYYMLQYVNISLRKNAGTDCKSQFQIDFPTWLFVCLFKV